MGCTSCAIGCWAMYTYSTMHVSLRTPCNEALMMPKYTAESAILEHEERSRWEGLATMENQRIRHILAARLDTQGATKGASLRLASTLDATTSCAVHLLERLGPHGVQREQLVLVLVAYALTVRVEGRLQKKRGGHGRHQSAAHRPVTGVQPRGRNLGEILWALHIAGRDGPAEGVAERGRPHMPDTLAVAQHRLSTMQRQCSAGGPARGVEYEGDEPSLKTGLALLA
eukprot:scaffold40252_cov28-Tisochrysis_lutea.AAC.1